MTSQSWLTAISNAEKTCIIEDGKRKVHYKFTDGREMVEEYSMDTNVVLKRAWKITKKFGSQPKWETEIGDPDPLFSEEIENVGIKESSLAPFTTARITKNCLEWRIRNLPYPLDNYIVTADPNENCIVVKTKNKKFFKKISVPDLQRIGIKVEQERIEISHKFNTLVISYKKPPALVLSEKLIFEEINKIKAVKESDQCILPQNIVDLHGKIQADFLPCRWLNYTNSGTIHGTRFIALKVPLREGFNTRLPASKCYTPAMVLQTQPNLKLIIDLTFTTKYYNGEKEFEKNGVKYVKLKCKGKEIPSEEIFQRFVSIVDEFIANNPQDYLIGVHCTHGVNRTGYLIVRYMITRLNYASDKALQEVMQLSGPITSGIFMRYRESGQQWRLGILWDTAPSTGWYNKYFK